MKIFDHVGELTPVEMETVTIDGKRYYVTDVILIFALFSTATEQERVQGHSTSLLATPCVPSYFDELA